MPDPGCAERIAAAFASTAPITCVPPPRPAFEVAEKASAGGSGGMDAGFFTLGMTCVPGIGARADFIASSKAPRPSTALLAARGDTSGVDTGGASGSGGGPYIESRFSRCMAGSAVCANGFTCDVGGPPPKSLAGARGSTAGVPHAAQNFREPISSAPHLAQWVMDEPFWVESRVDTSAQGRR